MEEEPKGLTFTRKDGRFAMSPGDTRTLIPEIVEALPAHLQAEARSWRNNEGMEETLTLHHTYKREGKGNTAAGEFTWEVRLSVPPESNPHAVLQALEAGGGYLFAHYIEASRAREE